jgi:hypothetical protein
MYLVFLTYNQSTILIAILKLLGIHPRLAKNNFKNMLKTFERKKRFHIMKSVF